MAKNAAMKAVEKMSGGCFKANSEGEGETKCDEDSSCKKNMIADAAKCIAHKGLEILKKNCEGQSPAECLNKSK